MRIEWTEPALDDVAGIQAYIAKDSPFYARQFVERLFEVAVEINGVSLNKLQVIVINTNLNQSTPTPLILTPLILTPLILPTPLILVTAVDLKMLES